MCFPVIRVANLPACARNTNLALTIEWICIRGKSEFNSRIHYFQIDSWPLFYTFKSTSAKESSGKVVDFQVLKRMGNI